MYEELSLTCLTLNEEGLVIPWDNLDENNFKFKHVSTNEQFFPSTFVNQGNGNYTFYGWKKNVGGVLVSIDDIQPVYVYIDDIPRYNYGVFYIGALDLHFLDKSSQQEINAVKDFKVFPTLPEDSPDADYQPTHKKYVDDVNDNTIDYLNNNFADLAKDNTFLGNNLHKGNNTFHHSGEHKFVVDPLDPELPGWPYLEFENFIESNYTPPNPNSLVHKDFLIRSLASLSLAPYQESSNIVRVVPDGNNETGKVYRSIQAAINYFSQPSESRQYVVYICGPGLTSQYIFLNHIHLKNYIHLTGSSLMRSIAGNNPPGLVLGGNSDSVTKIISLLNLNIYMGAFDIENDRTYNSFNFDNCTIYAYKSLMFNNCKLHNCLIYQPSGQAITLNGTTEMIDCKIMQQLIIGGSFQGLVINSPSEINSSFSMPTDPTLST
ncbi:MAG: hypothetical protein FJ216_07375 [Ignavibacteria bacterium]|nr:hypothetical protein [Ignavibacteria bacterium]